MSRLRTHTTRRRARELKQGGLYTLQHGYSAALRWGDSGESIALPRWYEDMRRPYNPEDDYR